MIKIVEKTFINIVLERDHFIENESIKKKKNKISHLKNSLSKIVVCDFPMILYFNDDKELIENFKFNNFEDNYGLDFKKISHSSPWEIDILTLPENPIYLLIISLFVIPTSITQLIGLYYEIKKNRTELSKIKEEQSKEFLNKFKEFLTNIKDNTPIKEIYKNLRKVKDKDVRNEITDLYSDLVYELNFKLNKIEMRIVLDGLKCN